MNAKRITFILGIVAVVAVGIFLFQRQIPQDSGQHSVKIGAIIPLSGEVSTYGDALRKGFDLAAAEFEGRFEIKYEDSKAIPKDGITAYQKLSSLDGVRFFLGDATSGVCLAIAPLAESGKTPMIISIATSDGLKDAGDYIFRNAPANFRQAETATSYMLSVIKAASVAVIYKQNPYGDNLAKAFSKDASSKKLNIVIDLGYPESTRDFTDIVAKLINSGCQAVFCPGNYEETAALLRKAREAGLAVPFVGTDGAYSPKLIELAGNAAEGFALTMMAMDDTSASYQAFQKHFKARYGVQPDVFCAYGYEGAKILMQSIVKAKSAEPESVQRVLSVDTFDSLTGPLQFDKDGEVERNYGVLKVKNSTFVNH